MGDDVTSENVDPPSATTTATPERPEGEGDDGGGREDEGRGAAAADGKKLLKIGNCNFFY